ncbi:hypothetical protein KY290_033714 [Solanum tuberosum]|uniref:Integrase catalytic domain-containing protein n=1 Tax=Solanum tuberosum TaxID=4113 RepID=A0ABQ7U2T9_SOLTU|nr:hypothetical protein KY289_033088 [Solanum tuberosum]KAH0647730.1 hypothetical protein KY285_032978 [Solanum tuberosum]KAH0740671.1 hypothetical protein KY290_033714 [Solanum tuberosum]
MHAKTFQEDLLIIPLGGYDLLLGNDWMKKHNPTKFDHERNCVTIGRKNNKLVLKGISEEGKLSVINSGAMGKLLKKGNALFAHLFMMNSTIDQDQEIEVILQMLDQFVDVFSKPKSLPPIRILDHSINLKPGSNPNEGLDDIRMQETGQLMTISTTIPMWIQEVNNSYEGDSQALELLAQTTVGQQGPSLWHFSSGILKRKGKVYVGGNGDLCLQMIRKFHDSPLGGHSGQLGTLKRLSQVFYWPNMKHKVIQFVASCDVCHRNKDENAPYPGLLQPLPIPDQAWSHIFMDFIKGLPMSRNNEVVLVVMDRMTEYAHFIALSHPYTTVTIADALFKLLGTQLNYGTAYDPQSDGQTEQVNRCLENYLRCMTANRPTQQSHWLPAAEWWFNTNFHTSLQCTPFEDLYGYSPPQVSIGPLLETMVPAADDAVMRRQQWIQLLKDNLSKAQERMKFYADKKRSEREFQKTFKTELQAYREIAKVGNVPYKFELPPPDSKIHSVFHVSLLKKKVGEKVVVQTNLPTTGEDGQFQVKPVAILQRQQIKRNNVAVVKVLV